MALAAFPALYKPIAVLLAAFIFVRLPNQLAPFANPTVANLLGKSNIKVEAALTALPVHQPKSPTAQDLLGSS